MAQANLDRGQWSMVRSGHDLTVCSDGTAHPGSYTYVWDATTLKGYREGHLVGDACGKSSGSPHDDNPLRFTYQPVGDPATASTTTATPPGPKTTIPGEGTFRVGVDVAAGTYTSSPAKSGYNSWGTRLSALSDTPATMIEVQYAEGPVYITIQPSDVAFKSEGRQTWTLVR